MKSALCKTMISFLCLGLLTGCGSKSPDTPAASAAPAAPETPAATPAAAETTVDAADVEGELVIYTSMYQFAIEMMDEALKEKFPNLKPGNDGSFFY